MTGSEIRTYPDKASRLPKSKPGASSNHTNNDDAWWRLRSNNFGIIKASFAQHIVSIALQITNSVGVGHMFPNLRRRRPTQEDVRLSSMLCSSVSYCWRWVVCCPLFLTTVSLSVFVCAWVSLLMLMSVVVNLHSTNYYVAMLITFFFVLLRNSCVERQLYLTM